MKAISDSLILCVILFSLCMVLVGYGVTIMPSLQKKFFALPKIIQKLYVILFMAPVIMLPFIPQSRYENYKIPGIAVGILITGFAVMIWVLALSQMNGVPSVRKAKGLVTGGIYGLVRNPIYTANFLILPGLALLASSTVALMYTPVWFIFLAILCIIEERDLKRQYGKEYHEYMEKVPYRLIKFVF